MSQQKPRSINIELPADLDPTYANFAVISHTPSEVIIDLAQMLPNQPKVRVRSRVVMTPLNAKLMLRALEDNLSKFESAFGEIAVPGQGDDLIRSFFGGKLPPETE
ncbi:MAG: DUF3467 domain-containing protein [Anaerolineae bacterium]|jgi:hypothetical protein|nr:DUF3467 domain-containing protein [Anaerolineae bacterium]